MQFKSKNKRNANTYVDIFNKLVVNIQMSREVRTHTFIILTPLNPIFIRKTWVFRGIRYFSYFCSKT